MDKNTTTVFGEEVDMTGIKTPYLLYRRMRPFYFSDSKKIQSMSREQFDYYMSQLSKDKKQDLFEEFTRQLVCNTVPDYMKAQNAVYGFYVVVIVDSPNNQKTQMRQLWELKSKSVLNNKEIVFVSAEERPTASKRK